jgi:hypothetical protein
MIIEDKIVTLEDAKGEETEYRIQPFPAFKGLVILKKLTKILGPSMTTLIGGSDGTEIDGSNIDKAIELLVENFDGDGVETLVRDLVKSVTKNGQPVAFDIEFMADYGKLLKLVAEIVKVNYGTVFQLGGFLQD